MEKKWTWKEYDNYDQLTFEGEYFNGERYDYVEFYFDF